MIGILIYLKRNNMAMLFILTMLITVAMLTAVYPLFIYVYMYALCPVGPGYLYQDR